MTDKLTVKIKPTRTDVFKEDVGVIDNNYPECAYDNDTTTCSYFSAFITPTASYSISAGYRTYVGFQNLPHWSTVKKCTLWVDCLQVITSGGGGFGLLGLIQNSEFVQLMDISRAPRTSYPFEILINSQADLSSLTPAAMVRANKNAGRNVSSAIQIYDIWLEFELKHGSAKKSALML